LISNSASNLEGHWPEGWLFFLTFWAALMADRTNIIYNKDVWSYRGFPNSCW